MTASREVLDAVRAAATAIDPWLPPEGGWLPHAMVPKVKDGVTVGWDKPPRRGARSNDPSTWFTLDQAMRILEHGADVDGIGFVVADGLIGLDFDGCRDPATGAIAPEVMEALEDCGSFAYVTPSGKGIRIVGLNGSGDDGNRIPGGKTTRLLPYPFGNTTGSGTRVEIFVGPTNFFNTLTGYVLDVGEADREREGKNTPLRDISGLVRDWLAGLPEVGDGGAGGAGEATPKERNAAAGAGDEGGPTTAPIEKVRLALEAIPNTTVDWERWSHIGMAAWFACGGSDEGREAWMTWSAQCDAYSDAACEERWEHWFRSPPTRMGWGTLHWYAQVADPDYLAPLVGRRGDPLVALTDAERGIGLEAAGVGAPPVGPVVGGGGFAGGAGGGTGLPMFSDEALALRMAEAEKDRIRYVATWGRWMIWDGVKWQQNETLAGLAIARRICTEAALIAPGKEAKGIVSARTIHAVEGLARADRRLAAKSDGWDRHPWLLNTPTGVIDLRTGKVSGNDPDLMMTRACRIGMTDLHMRSELWQRFLDRVTNRNMELQGYLQRMAGYCLTGVTTEDALFFLYGGGDNGKSTFVDTLSWILNEDDDGYARVTDIGTFAGGRGERHLTELARLRGARLVTTSETEEGRGWNEARIKQVTGGSPIAANFMRQDQFTFVPEFKPVISGNHKPRIRTQDVAMRRRINIAPFEVRIPEDEKDRGLAEKLQGEAGAILAWMVLGCLDWQRVGLRTPDQVIKATDAYFTSENSRAVWFNECIRGPTRKEIDSKAKVWIREADIVASWMAWAKNMNEPTGSRRNVVDWLNEQGYFSKPNPSNQNIYENLTMRTVFDEQEKKQEESGTVVAFPGSDKKQ